MKFRIPFVAKPPRVSVIRLTGVIGGAGRTGSGLSDAGTAQLIERAFSRGKPRAVALVINSPGGSPVQSSLIAARVRRLAAECKLPVHAFVEDVAASGGYWLACAADDIWADDSSILGSIGVISAGFGFPEFLARHGIERRVHTAGGSKSFLDPFRPEKPEDVARLIALQEPIHQAFIAQVKARRGARLAEGADLFTGEVFVGQQAVAVGLADGIGHVVPKMKELYGDKVQLVLHEQKRSFLRRIGVEAATQAMTAVEDRGHWARFGL